MLSEQIDHHRVTKGAILSAVSLLGLGRWLDFDAVTVTPEDAVLATIWAVSILLLTWLAASLTYWRIRLDTPQRGSAILDRLCIPGSRRLAQATLAATLTLLPACGSTGSEAPQLSYIGEIESTTTSVATTVTTIRNVTTTMPTTRPSTTEPPTTALPATTTTTPPTTSAPDLAPAAASEEPATPNSEHLVATGDHLWNIAESTLEASLGRSPDSSELGTYWRKLIDANQEMLLSGDPSLIYPGETLTIPPMAD